jgi:membrane protein implicated in regulation of membrane protease activity
MNCELFGGIGLFGAKRMGTLFLIMAVVGGTVLVCQFALTLLGLGHDGAGLGHHIGGDFQGDAHVGGDFHGDHAGGSHADANEHSDSAHVFSVISFRTLVAAIAVFGVSGRAALSAGYASSTSLVLAVIVGIAAMYGMYWLMRLVAGLNSSGNERIGNAVGRQATVYLRIPATRSGVGKVQLSMQNRIVEYQAFTDEGETLQAGESVEVVDIAGGDTVYVRRIAKPVHEQEAVSS